jgi:hypothetical protein
MSGPCIFKNPNRLARFCTLTVIALLLTAPPSLTAQTADTNQSLSTEVAAEVSWGSANGCMQNIRTDSFAALTPQADSSRVEPFDASPEISASVDPRGDHVWVGCVPLVNSKVCCSRMERRSSSYSAPSKATLIVFPMHLSSPHRRLFKTSLNRAHGTRGQPEPSPRLSPFFSCDLR